jgi:glycosyltransferase involved in cell wall biosynthesis
MLLRERADTHDSFGHPAAATTPVVVHVVLSLGPGGTEQLVVALCARAGARYRPVVCCLDEPGSWGLELQRRGMPLLALRRTPGFHPSLGYRIARFAASHGATVLHCHHYSPFVYGRVASLVSPGLKMVFTEHGRYDDGPPLRKRQLVNPVLARVPGPIYAVSAALREHMLREGFPARRVGVIHNGIDPGPLPREFDRRRARKALGARGDELLIGTAARLDRVKDLPTLIAAFAALREEQPNARLVIAGEGSERARLEGEIANRGLSGAVSLLGHRDDVRALLPGLDLYVNSSISEGISVTILEAMAAALPVVATRVGGTPEVVADGSNGLLVPARSPRHLALVLRGLARHPAARQALGRAARRTVERDFHIDTMIDRYTNIYSELAG